MDLIRLSLELIWELLFGWIRKTRVQTAEPSRRKVVENRRVRVCVHEWGGYPLVRRKYINDTICEWECGLQWQLDRFGCYRGAWELDLTVTLSDASRCSHIDYIRQNSDRVEFVPNEGMDFSGYAHFYDMIKDGSNSYVILSNSSVNSAQCDFLDSYLDYMEEHTDVGMLGISCCSRCYQSLVRNNFTPHLQSFFLLTTIDVLRQVVEYNAGVFPGVGITNKRLLIRRGEIAISRLVMQLGYKLAVVTQHGVKQFTLDPHHWSLPLGDYRSYTLTPNAINPINN